MGTDSSKGFFFFFYGIKTGKGAFPQAFLEMISNPQRRTLQAFS